MGYKGVSQTTKCSHWWKLLPGYSIGTVQLVFFLFISIYSFSAANVTSPAEDPNIVALLKQLEQVQRERDAEKQQEAEDRRKEAQMREEENKLREWEAKLQQPGVAQQQAVAEKQRGKNPDSQNQPSEPTKAIETKNTTKEEPVRKKPDLPETDDKRQQTAIQLLEQKYLRGQTHNDTLINEILDQCLVQNCSSIVIKQAVEKILQKIKITTLIRTERKLNSSIEESAYVYRFASDKISKKDYPAWIELAIRVKEIMAWKASSNVTALLKRIRDNKIPNKIKNLIFSTLVCIKNYKYNEFLYAVGSPELWYDDNRRHIFTRIGGSRNGTGESREFAWKLESINGTNEFFVINHKHKEHLFVDNSKWDESNRFAFTWTDDKPVTQNVWQIALNSEGRYFEIKNTQSKEYLFADYDRIFNGTMRCVFTHTSGANNVEGLWDFINCSNEK